uniref:Secreted protein n=1 Tax=Rhipicephalus microplus TaxID=6941 RepID=A0A6M2DF37_RHIMP
MKYLTLLDELMFTTALALHIIQYCTTTGYVETGMFSLLDGKRRAHADTLCHIVSVRARSTRVDCRSSWNQ